MGIWKNSGLGRGDCRGKGQVGTCLWLEPKEGIRVQGEVGMLRRYPRRVLGNTVAGSPASVQKFLVGEG